MAAPPPPYGEQVPGGYPPPPGGNPPPPGQMPPQPQVIVVQNVHFDRFPVQVTCPNCQQLVQSRVEYEIGTATWLIGCFICVCAFCIDACKDAVHMCPSCSHILGRKGLI